MNSSVANRVADNPKADSGKWKIHWKLEKFHDKDLHEIAGATPDEVVEHSGNLLMYGGVSALWETLIGNGTATAGQALTYFNNANAAIGVGDSAAAAAASQTDLQAASNKLRVAMNSTYPLHTDGLVIGSATITFQATFGVSQGNWTWNEVAVFNSPSAGVGRMLNRLVQSFGTKSGGSWSMSVNITIS